MNAKEFNALSTYEQHKVVVATRAGRTNLQCLQDIFGARSVPFTATAFHVGDGEAVFLDTGARNQAWYEPVGKIKLTEETALQLKMVGMYGSLGWDIRSGDLASIVSRASKTVSQ